MSLNLLLNATTRMSEAFNWSYLHLLFYIYELLTHFGSNPPIHMLVVYKLSWKVKKMCMKKNKRVPSVSVPQRNAFAFETSCCSTQHPDVCFCVVMTVLEDSFRLGGNGRRQRGYYLVQSPDSLTLRCSWSLKQVAAVTAPSRIHCFSSTSGLGLPSRVHATGSSVKAWAQKVWSSPAMEKGEGTSGCCGRSVSPAQNRWWNVPLVWLGSAGHPIKHIVPLDHLA